jgi:hypothetical protein
METSILFYEPNPEVKNGIHFTTPEEIEYSDHCGGFAPRCLLLQHSDPVPDPGNRIFCLKPGSSS